VWHTVVNGRLAGLVLRNFLVLKFRNKIFDNRNTSKTLIWLLLESLRVSRKFSGNGLKQAFINRPTS
jgi:hypothetical protein